MADFFLPIEKPENSQLWVAFYHNEFDEMTFNYDEQMVLFDKSIIFIADFDYWQVENSGFKRELL